MSRPAGRLQFGGLPELDAIAFRVRDPAEAPVIGVLDPLIHLGPPIDTPDRPHCTAGPGITSSAVMNTPVHAASPAPAAPPCHANDVTPSNMTAITGTGAAEEK